MPRRCCYTTDALNADSEPADNVKEKKSNLN